MANFDVHIFDDAAQGRGFKPQKVVVTIGDTVTWINDGPNGHKHNAHRDSAPTFDTGLLALGEKKVITFNQATGADGLAYSCTPHPDMTGSIVVVLPGSSLEAFV